MFSVKPHSHRPPAFVLFYHKRLIWEVHYSMCFGLVCKMYMHLFIMVYMHLHVFISVQSI